MTSAVLPRRLLINSTAIFGGEAIARLSTALMAMVVARFYGMDALGNYGYALALASVLLLVPDFGLHLFAMRELSSSPQQLPEVFWNVHWMKLGLTGAVSVFALCFGIWGIANRERRVVFYILVIRVLLQSFSHAAMAVFKALERMHYIAFQQSVNSTVVVVWVAASLIFGAALPVMAAGLVVGQLAETLMGWSILRRLVAASRWMRWDRTAIVRIAAASFPFGLTAILLALNLRIDILVLSHYVSSRILGQFNAAVWFVVAMFLGASLLMSVLFPRLSRVLAVRSGPGSDYIRSLVKNVLMFAAVGSLLVWIAAPGLIRLFFGPDFSPAASILRILAPALPLVFLNTIFFYVFAAARRRFVCLGTLSLGIGIGTLLSVYLASRYGATGAATADVVREFVMSGVYLCFLIQGDHARLAGIALLKVFAGATALLVLTVQFAGTFHIRFMWLAAWMFFVLMGTLMTLGFPNIREWHLLTDDRL
jgi:O-antigen/teichoic acid export membrane protein